MAKTITMCLLLLIAVHYFYFCSTFHSKFLHCGPRWSDSLLLSKINDCQTDILTDWLTDERIALFVHVCREGVMTDIALSV